ncbi:hypothetical protein KVR01_001345 [Diaporthe batatas]|uniref:uncharacterized protein n=1 Tax=Diaporthe batatas TaxID=748121 RepID=UPI001D046DC5|nr:uncharacterized protein KVR01_001345 [Diaporthe batatas]KAG8168596.1 hypothetical protein KVR01_001345 [Diaporthe batatas]
MAVFVDLEDDDVEPLEQGHNLARPVWTGNAPPDCSVGHGHEEHNAAPLGPDDREEATHEPAVAEAHLMTVALGCYPIVMAVAAQLDLNDLDSLSRTCRGVHDSLLQYRSILLKSTLHCTNEDLPVDPESTLRYRARAGNWYYMEDTSRSSYYNGKAGSCARDMVSKCRKCSTVMCRNCAIKPPAPAVMRDRHRRLCLSCQKAPIGCLVKPPLSSDIPAASGLVQRAICTCETAGVWLCQPCGRGIRGADSEYRGIWKWRSQYGEVLGGLGTGIGGNKYIEHETDCDAADAREAEDLLAQGQSAGTSPTTLSLYSGAHSWGSSHSNLSLHSNSSTPGLLDPTAANTRTPSPALGPGYARHEVEGIGNKIKSVKITMVRVGGGVPEWEDEKASGQSLRREATGHARSWCGWCSRVIPSKKDYQVDEKNQASKN